MGGRIELSVRVPALSYSARAQVRTACARALCLELEQAADEMREYEVTRVTVENACCLSDHDLDHLFAQLKRLVRLDGAYRVATCAPEQTSTGIMTTLRNFHTDMYVFDLGSLNPTEFHALGRPYAPGANDILARMIASYRMRNWCAVVELGIPGQTATTLRDSLSRLLAMTPGPGAVRIRMRDVNAEDPETLARWEGLFELACEMLEESAGDAGVAGGAAGAEGGLRRVGAFEFARKGFEGAALARGDAPADVWAMGPGGVSYMDGCTLYNERSAAKYLANAANGEIPAPAVVRLGERDAMLRNLEHGLLGAKGADENVLVGRHGGEAREALNRLARERFTASADGRIRLTTKGAVCWRKIGRVLRER
jgi:coproporphyrinogen III oxidase-like Fe-S oxidoreductase